MFRPVEYSKNPNSNKFNVIPCQVSIEKLAPSRNKIPINQKEVFDLRDTLNSRRISTHAETISTSAFDIEKKHNLSEVNLSINKSSNYGEDIGQNLFAKVETPLAHLSEDQLLNEDEDVESLQAFSVNEEQILKEDEDQLLEPSSTHKNVDYETLSIFGEEDREDLNDDLNELYGNKIPINSNSSLSSNKVQKTGIKRPQTNEGFDENGWHPKEKISNIRYPIDRIVEEKPKLQYQKRASLNMINQNKNKQLKKFDFSEIKDNIVPVDNILQQMGSVKVQQMDPLKNQAIDPLKEKKELLLSPKEKPDSILNEPPQHIFIVPTQLDLNQNKLKYFKQQSFQDNYRKKGEKSYGHSTNARLTDAPPGYCYEHWNKGKCSRQNCRFMHQGLFKSAENGGNIDERLKKSLGPTDPKEKLKILDRKSESPIGQRIKVIKELESMNLSNAAREAFQTGIEDTLITLNDQEKSNNNANIAYDIVEIKRRSFTKLKDLDLYYCAKIQAESGNFKRAFELLKEFLSMVNENHSIDNDVKKKWEEVFLACIETSGSLFDHWDSFKTAALNSDQIIDKVLTVVDSSIVESRLKQEDLSICQKKLINGTLNLSESTLTKFLKLYSSTESLKNVVDLIKVLPNLSILPIVTVEKILMSIHDFSDAENSIGLLNRLPSSLAVQCSTSWNSLVVECCQKGSKFLQVAEQLYGIMKRKDIKLTPECGIYLLNSLCVACQCDSFVKRVDEFEQMNIFQDFRAPGWFTESLACILNKYDGGSKTFTFKIVMLLLASSYQPEEQKISSVLDGLISVRKFSDVLELVKKCFQFSVILSQKVLRKVIFYLEEWTSNPDASIEIYTLTRKIYPRPADYFSRCNKCSKTLSNPIASMRSSNSDHQTTPRANDDLEPDGESDDLIVNDEKYLIPRLTYACSDYKSGLLETLCAEIVKLGKPNSQSIVNAIFLGVSNCEDQNDSFQSIVNIFLNISSDGYLCDDSEAVLKTIGQVGVRLIKFLFNLSKFAEAYHVLAYLDEKNIPYIECGKAFGLLLHTSKDMSACDILVMCCSVCFKCDVVESALNLFKRNVLVNKICVSGNELNEIYETAHSIFKGLFHENRLELSWSFYKELNESSYRLPRPIVEKVLNDICAGSFLKMFSFAEEIYTHVQSLNLPVHSATTRAYLEYLMNNQEQTLAQEIFDKCLKVGVYKTSSTDSLCLEISPDLLPGEMFLFIKHHFENLCNISFQSVDSMFKGYFKLVCVTSEKLELSNINESQMECKKILLKVLNDFKPQLDKKDSDKYVEVSVLSIRRWFESQQRENNANTAIANRQKRFVAMPTSEKVSFIEDGKPNMKMTICPTPRYDILSDPRASDVEPKEATEAVIIRADIFKQCALLMNANLIKREKFSDTVTCLYNMFVEKLKEEGTLLYDEDVAHKVISYVNEFYKEFV